MGICHSWNIVKSIYTCHMTKLGTNTFLWILLKYCYVPFCTFLLVILDECYQKNVLDHLLLWKEDEPSIGLQGS